MTQNADNQRFNFIKNQKITGWQDRQDEKLEQSSSYPNHPAHPASL
jgi:hypothetical protein